MTEETTYAQKMAAIQSALEQGAAALVQALREIEDQNAIIERRGALIGDMMTVMMNRLDEKDTKVKALLLRGIEEMPEDDFIPE
jgi:hypothetical protein